MDPISQGVLGASVPQAASDKKHIAAATLFLASDRARQITGVDLPVDGGWAAL